MPIVTLTTDFGHKDYSVSVIKGALIQQISNVRIIDISHEISPYNPSETAYILKNAFQSFPPTHTYALKLEKHRIVNSNILLHITQISNLTPNLTHIIRTPPHLPSTLNR